MDCLIGGWCGDAAGATLEFYHGNITKKMAFKAMHMPGGGALNVAPGQVTDDSELELALLDALHNKDPFNGFPIEDVARNYIAWHKSIPFDMGMSCSKAFGFASSSRDMLNNAQKYNMHSEANGALMRIAGLAVWARDVPNDKIIEYAKMDATLSHPNVICQECNALYCLAITHLLKHEGDAKGAYQLVLDNANYTKDWLNEPIDTLDARINIGHVKHAFRLAMHHLKLETSYKHGIIDTLIRGGDTDTNAKIVGNVLGALHGMDCIPDYMSEPVMTFDCVKHNVKKTLIGINRPSMYGVKYFMKRLIA